MTGEHTVGLRELRHHTADVLVLTRLAESGRLRRAERPGYRPHMQTGDDTNLLGDALAELRGKERW